MKRKITYNNICEENRNKRVNILQNEKNSKILGTYVKIFQLKCKPRQIIDYYLFQPQGTQTNLGLILLTHDLQ